MRCMARNKVTFWYALYTEIVPITDDYGNFGGEYNVKHGNPIKGRANISAAKGETQTRQFGEAESYDKVVVMDNDAPALDEYSILWVDRKPELNEDGSLVLDDKGNAMTPHDYIVKKVARSLNGVSYAISKVNVSG